MEWLAFLLAIIMGFTLGLLGGGGSILTLPILTYVMAVEPVTATAYSLFVVGATAVVGTWRKAREKMVAWREGLTFALPSLVAVFLTRYWLVPALPEVLWQTSAFKLTKDVAVMIFFALVMLAAAYSMIRPGKPSPKNGAKASYLWIIIDGLVVGLITGLVGAGGGFLIVPALVLLVRLPIKMAVGTSLMIIALKSLIGFSGDLLSGMAIDWALLLPFTGFSILGLFIGSYATRFIAAAPLKRLFGWFVLLMALLILYLEFS